jgi:hypothetical protein
LAIDKETQAQLATIVLKETKKKFKKIADKYHQSIAARIAYLIDQDIEAHENDKSTP